MTIDEDAAKAIRGWLEETGIRYLPAERDMLHDVVAAFGHRCAEAMRKECVKTCQGLAETFERNSKVMNTEHKVIMSHVIEGTIHCEQAIRRVEVK